MIRYAQGNLLQADAEALVNTVNTVGRMGKGIALQFKQAFPDNFAAYARACKADEVRPGRMFITETGMTVNPRYIINFPTKRHWRNKSRLDDIDTGLAALIADVQRLGIRSVAVPPLGCGNGGLDWSAVHPRIVAAFERIPEVDVLLFAPTGAPPAEAMPVRTRRPNMTVARALLVMLMDQYQELDYRLTLLEIQKLAYFLQEAGEKLRLRYEPGHYGPYADNLNKVLERIEGHFIRGYGDSQKPDAAIGLLKGTRRAAEELLQAHADSMERLERVARLIMGFETPYGMELLASLHWLAHHNDPRAESTESATYLLHNWNDRKARMFKPSHIAIAWQRLRDEGWLPASQIRSAAPKVHHYSAE